jgi:hypothetical protein
MPRDRGPALAAGETFGGARMAHSEAWDAMGVGNANRLRYAAATGTVLIRWEGARQPTVWSVPPPDVDPRDARLELARRYPHVYGSATPEAFGVWAGIGPRPGAAAYQALGQELTPVKTPVGNAWILSQDEAAFRAAPEPTMHLEPPVPGRRRLLPSPGSRSRPPGPGPRPP